MNTDKLKITYRHYRIPSEYRDELSGRKGRPPGRLVYRYRHKFGFEISDDPPLEFGGVTICDIVDENGREFSADAWCSLSDQFQYKIGRAIALGRALKRMEESNEVH